MILARPLRRFFHPQLLSSAAIVGAMTIGVKGVAFLKELVLAHRFGTSDEVDAFLVAMLIPAMAALAVGNAFRDALVPAYAEQRLRGGSDARQLVSNTVWGCAVVLLLVALVSVLFSDSLMKWLAQGFPGEKQARSAQLFYLVVPYLVCVGVANVLKGYLQTHGQFALSSAAPALIPGCTIIALLLMPATPSGEWLALGTSVGAISLMVLLIVASQRVHRDGLLRRPGWDEPTRSVLRHTVPLLAGTAIIEGYYFVDTMMAAMLEAGSVATLAYGERICGVFCIAGAAITQALFPHLSDLAARGSWRPLIQTVLGFSGLIIAGSIPVILMFWFAAEPIVQFVFERGEFTSTDTRNVAEVLRFAGFQVPGAILVALGARVVMALRANHIVLATAVVGLATNVILNLILMRWYGVKGVALSTALVNGLSALMLYTYAAWRLRKLDATTGGEE